MKTTNLVSNILIIAIILASAIQLAFAQEASKKISKSFQVQKDAEFIVENRFGRIHCNVWDKNEISIEVDISATGRDAREAERLLEGVKVEIQGNASKVEAITTMPERTTRSERSVVTVDYTIYMPVTLNLRLSNKFGDIYLDENTGTSVINLDYGGLQVNRLGNKDHELNMRFSKGTLGMAKNLKLNISYSELKAGEIVNLLIDSKFSTFEVEHAGTITHDSQYDTSNLGELKSIKTVAKFSTIKIGSVSEVLDLDMRYGGCTVKEIGPQFREIVIINSFGNVDLRFDPDISFNLEAESNFGGVRFPQNSDVKVEETSFTGKIYKGIVGKDIQTTRRVIVTTKNGDVSIKMK